MGYESSPPPLTVNGLFCTTERAVEEIAEQYPNGDRATGVVAREHLRIGDCAIFRGLTVYVVSRGKMANGPRGPHVVVGLALRPNDPAGIFAFIDEKILAQKSGLNEIRMQGLRKAIVR